jgi:hypothetical protein
MAEGAAVAAGPLVRPLPDQMADPRRTCAGDDDSELHRRPSLPSGHPIGGSARSGDNTSLRLPSKTARLAHDLAASWPAVGLTIIGIDFADGVLLFLS